MRSRTQQWMIVSVGLGLAVLAACAANTNDAPPVTPTITSAPASSLPAIPPPTGDVPILPLPTSAPTSPQLDTDRPSAVPGTGGSMGPATGSTRYPSIDEADAATPGRRTDNII